MIKVMFWNINRKKGFEKVICNVIKKENIDILLLAEAENVIDSVIESGTSLKREKSPITNDQINLTPRFYTSNSGFKLSHYHTVQNTKRLVFCFLEIPKNNKILLAGIHFPSKLEYDNETQSDIANSYINWIVNVEKGANNKRTIIFGDFNMNPFESGMIGPKTFNATLSKNKAAEGPRVFQRDDIDYFYNPMWNFMGDINYVDGVHKLPGSYFFHTTSDSSATYWNVFDKVICRPQIIDSIDLSSIEYLKESLPYQFVTIDANNNYVIDKLQYSDHLPLIFKVKK